MTESHISLKSDQPLFVSLLLDETGSMEPIKRDTVRAVNQYISSLQKTKSDIHFSLVTFNSSQTRARIVAEPIASVKRLKMRDYWPNHMTPLIDASVKIIRATEEAVEARDDSPDVVVVIQTDE